MIWTHISPLCSVDIGHGIYSIVRTYIISFIFIFLTPAVPSCPASGDHWILNPFAHFTSNWVVVLMRTVDVDRFVKLLPQVDRTKLNINNNERKTFGKSFSIIEQQLLLSSQHYIKQIEWSTLQRSVRTREVNDKKMTTENTSLFTKVVPYQSLLLLLLLLFLHVRTKYSNLFLCVIANWLI